MNVFATRVNGFDPLARPVVTFGVAGNRDALVRASEPGDLVLFVGTQAAPTAEAERGRLLGLAEFARTPVDTRELVDLDRLAPHEFKADGSLAWPNGLPILRAWLFPEPRLKLLDVLRAQLPYEATPRAVLLGEADARAVLALPRSEVKLPASPAVERLRGFRDALAGSKPTTGPVPVGWKGEVERRSEGRSWTYAMRFGRRNVWKVGQTQDLDERLADVNRHVPFEETGERWAVVLTQAWPEPRLAYAMEQRVFARLRARRTVGERIACREADLMSAWTASLSVGP